MIRDADNLLQEHFERNPALHREWEQYHMIRNDPRLTHVGHFARRYSLDELPKPFSVVMGDMSLVGPRPIVEEEIPKYGEVISLYYQARPDINGLWQVSGRSELDYDHRVQLDAYYVRNWSVWLDLVIIARTFWAVLSGRGAY